jgi:hypothetical protein
MIHIPYLNCKVNFVYTLRARNLSLGAFTAAGTFIGLRTKFDSVFLDQELHFDRGGSARPLKLIAAIPDDIPLTFSLGTYDINTSPPEMVAFDKPIADGGKGWFYIKDGVPSKDIRPCSKLNTKLFNYLKDLEAIQKLKEINI